MWERLSSGLLADTKEDVDAIECAGLRLGYSPRDVQISLVGPKITGNSPSRME